MRPQTFVIIVLVCALVAVSIAFAVVANGMHKDADSLRAQNSELARMNAAYKQGTGNSGHFSVSKDWAKRPHADTVSRSDPATCFLCHKESWCAQCHVKLIH